MAAAAFLMAATAAYADNDAILSKIEAANASVMTVEAHFVQTRLLKASGKTMSSEGTFDYIAPDRLSMEYDSPSTDRLIINGIQLYNSRNGKATLFDTSKNQPMAAMSSTLLHCIQGKVKKVAEDNNALINIEETDGSFVITLCSRTQSTRGYTKIVLTFRKSDCVLTVLELQEAGGISTTYAMSSIRLGASVDPSVFTIPKR